ncbi:MAG: hypothetical protein O7G32_10945 [SAR324 cluster bacterium]|nr:hypothetical protein [SAR324 cluster bacterium]
MATKARRSFSQQNLEFRHSGELGEQLAEALRVPAHGGYVLTHRFHPYPGRFHPHLPRRLLKDHEGTEIRVFDPFMGGGTALVEAMLLGLPTEGNDLNPVASLVARERTQPRSSEQAERIKGEAGRIAAQVEALRREKNPPRVRQRNLERLAPHYQQHLLAELLQWLRLVNALPQIPARETLRAVFSSGVVKYSNRLSDSVGERDPPRYPKGAVTRFFVAKCDELLEAQVTLGRRLIAPAQVRLHQEDSLLLPSLGWGLFDIIITSPPYPGTYDYYEQHRLRMDWLELESESFQSGELGARRETRQRRWSHGMKDVMTSLYRVLRPGGSLFLVLGDWVEGDHGVDAATALRRIAKAVGWREGASASARRGTHSRKEQKAFSKKGKWEHLIEFRRP